MESNLNPSQRKRNQESESSDSDVVYSSESDEAFGVPLEKEEAPLHVNDWVVVKFCSKKIVRRFVGKVTECSKMGKGRTIRFGKHVEQSRFKWPEKDDEAEIDLEQVDARLTPPEFCF